MFNYVKVRRLENEKADLQHHLDKHKLMIEELNIKIKELEDYKLKYRVTKLYVDDDEALLEIFEAAKEKEKKQHDYLDELWRGQQQDHARNFDSARQASLDGLNNAGMGQVGFNTLSDLYNQQPGGIIRWP